MERAHINTFRFMLLMETPNPIPQSEKAARGDRLCSIIS